MGFQQFLKSHEWPSYYFLPNLVEWTKLPGAYDSSINLDRIEPHWREHVASRVREDGKSYILHMSTMSAVLCKGPKVLRLQNLAFEMFENIDLNISVEDYNQPFPATVVEIPENYSQTKLIRDPVDDIIRRPIAVVIQHIKDVGICCVSAYFTDDSTYNIMIDHRGTIEEQINTNLATMYDRSLPMTDEERVACKSVMKACLNACLYVDDFGHREVGPLNPSLYQRQQRYIKVAEKEKDAQRISKAKRELKSHPFYFELKQEIKLRVSRSDTGKHQATGIKVKPHWRKGHYRMHRYGPGLSSKKRIRIEAVFVNGDLFLGNLKDTVTIHKD